MGPRVAWLQHKCPCCWPNPKTSLTRGGALFALQVMSIEPVPVVVEMLVVVATLPACVVVHNVGYFVVVVLGLCNVGQ